MIGREAPRVPLRVAPAEPAVLAPTVPGSPPTAVRAPVGTLITIGTGEGQVPLETLGRWADGRAGAVTVRHADVLVAAAAAERLAALGLESHWIGGTA